MYDTSFPLLNGSLKLPRAVRNERLTLFTASQHADLPKDGRLRHRHPAHQAIPAVLLFRVVTFWGYPPQSAGSASRRCSAAVSCSRARQGARRTQPALWVRYPVTP